MARVAAPSLAATSASTKCPMPRVSFPAFRARSWAVTTTARASSLNRLNPWLGSRRLVLG